MLELNGKPSSVTTFSTIYSLQNLGLGNLFEFSMAKITLKSLSPTLSIQINPIKFYSSRSFQQHQKHIPIPLQFLAMI